MTVEHISVPANDKVFIDSVIRNTSLAVRDNALDNDDENEDSDVDTSGNESSDDVCIIDSDDSPAGSSDEYNYMEPLPGLRNLNISCSKDLFDHVPDVAEETQVGCIDMEISSSLQVGEIECNVPVLSAEQQITMEGQNPSTVLLPPGYENEFTGLDEQLSPVKEKKFICSMSAIRELFSFCMDIDCKMPLVEVKERFVGCVVEITWKCLGGHCGKWKSSKAVNNIYVNNIQAAASLLYTGNNCTKLSLFSKCLPLAFFSSTTFYQYQKRYLAPQVKTWWTRMQDSMFSALSSKPVVVAGDGQMDSPGFCAKNCTYTLMHADLDYILHVEMVDVRHSQLKSATMEKVGCERALDFLMKKLSVEELVTDASSQLIKLLGEYTSSTMKQFIQQNPSQYISPSYMQVCPLLTSLN